MASKTLANLLKWFDEVGIRLEDCIQIREDDSGSLGVFATSDLAEGQSLALVPKSAILSVLTCSLAELIDKEQLGGGLALTLALMYERALGPASRWAPYIASLPPGGEYLPMFWSESERGLLAGTEAAGRGEHDAAMTEADYAENVAPLFTAYPALFPPELRARMTARDFQIAASWVSSRDFGVDDEHRDSMVPLCDIFNHKASIVRLTDDFEVANQDGSETEDDDAGAEEGAEDSSEGDEADAKDGTDSDEGADGERPKPVRQAPGAALADLFRRVSPADVAPRWRLHIGIVDADAEEDPEGAEGEDALRIIAASALPAGSEVMNTYGEHGNDVLLCKYGFALRENPFMSVKIARKELVAGAESALGKAKAKKRLRFLADHTHLLDDDEDGDPIEDLELLPGGKLGGPLQVAVAVLGAREPDFKRWTDADGPLACIRGEYHGPSEEAALAGGTRPCGVHPGGGGRAAEGEGDSEEDPDEEDEGIALEPQEASVVVQRVGGEGAGVLRALVTERLRRFRVRGVDPEGAVDLAAAEARVQSAASRAAKGAAMLRLTELEVLSKVLESVQGGTKRKAEEEPAGGGRGRADKNTK